MKRLLIKVIIIIATFLIPLCIADIILTKHFRSRNYYPFTTWNNIVGGSLNSDTWILGSSRALVQYNPRILDSILKISSYNLGCNAQFIFLDIQCYQIAREYNPKPKYILLDLAYPSLTMEKAPISRYFYMPYINERKFRKIVKNNDNISSSYLYVPCYRYWTEKNNDMWYKNDDAPEYRGSKIKKCNWISTELSEIESIQYKCEPEAIDYLESFIYECKEDSISVILIHSPFQRDGFEKIQEHNEMLNLFRSIANRNGVPFLDYTNDPICYDTMNFYNAMHLNAHGADIFSAKLSHDLDSLGLIPSRK